MFHLSFQCPFPKKSHAPVSRKCCKNGSLLDSLQLSLPIDSPPHTALRDRMSWVQIVIWCVWDPDCRGRRGTVQSDLWTNDLSSSKLAASSSCHEQPAPPCNLWIRTICSPQHPFSADAALEFCTNYTAERDDEDAQ